ncbi:hypothetical protein V6N11_053707 [Hibiscus sabdariffa]|uniref:Uncharacterized protein n=1 Tax=Hibiscus sabdariffa TaxID=183260 RepID=A0ABR2S2K1_9ROSI
MAKTGAKINDNYQSPPLWCSIQGGSRTGTPGVHRVLEPVAVTSGFTSSTLVPVVEGSSSANTGKNHAPSTCEADLAPANSNVEFVPATSETDLAPASSTANSALADRDVESVGICAEPMIVASQPAVTVQNKVTN